MNVFIKTDSVSNDAQIRVIFGQITVIGKNYAVIATSKTVKAHTMTRDGALPVEGSYPPMALLITGLQQTPLQTGCTANGDELPLLCIKNLFVL